MGFRRSVVRASGVVRAGFVLATIAFAAAVVLLASPAGAQQTFTGGGAITVTSTQTTASSSTLSVSGATGSQIETIQVKINGLTTNGTTGYSLSYADIWLTAPGGEPYLVLLGGTGSGTDTLNGANIVISDSATSAAPNGTAWTAGTFRPGSYWGPNPPYGTESNWPQTDGGQTLNGGFGGAAPDGTWTLSIQNFYGVTTPISITSWSLTLTYAPLANTTTSLSTNAANNETTEGAAVTLTATVSSGGGRVYGGTVTFTDNGSNISCGGGNPSALNSSGQATCDATYSTEGAHPLTATYNGSPDYNGSSGSANLFVNHATTNPTAGEYCNTGGISISGSLSGTNNAASPYPSHIDVTGYSGIITGATLTLNGFSDADPEETVMLLAGPTSTNIVPWNDVGGATAVSDISFTLADSAGSSNTIPAPPGSGETYYPTADTGLGAAAFPSGTPGFAPPGTLSYAAPESTQTFTNAFSGISPNGYWSLYLYNRTGSTAVSATGWCINLLSQPTLSVASSHTGSFTQGDTSDTYTITVKNNGPVASSGTLSLADTLPSGLSAVSFAETTHTGGGTGSDWSCTGSNCTRTTAMPSGEQDTLTLTVSVGYNTATGTNAVTNSVNLSGGNAINSPTATDSTTINPGPVQVTFSTSPAGLSYSVNGTQYSSQQTLAVTNGSAVSLATTSPQTLAETQYTWNAWSDGGAISHTATVTSTTGTAAYTATFNAGSTACTSSNPNPNPNPESFSEVGDFNGDCKSDILWQNSSTGQLYEWLMNGTTTLAQQSPGGASSPWTVAGIGDFNGDHQADILWRNASTGQLYLWLMNGSAIISQSNLGTVSTAWSIVGVGDFDGDGNADILWWNSSTGQAYIWLMNGATITSQQSPGSASSPWTIVGVGDFNGDGKADILWQNSSTGQIYIWLMNGTAVASVGTPGSATSPWTIVGMGDFNADGKSDLLWWNSSTGQLYIWLMSGTTVTGQATPGGAASPWTVQGVADYNGDGKADILWQNSSTGQVYIWLMNGTAITTQATPGGATSPWGIAPPPGSASATPADAPAIGQVPGGSLQTVTLLDAHPLPGGSIP